MANATSSVRESTDGRAQGQRPLCCDALTVGETGRARPPLLTHTTPAAWPIDLERAGTPASKHHLPTPGSFQAADARPAIEAASQQKAVTYNIPQGGFIPKAIVAELKKFEVPKKGHCHGRPYLEKI